MKASSDKYNFIHQIIYLHKSHKIIFYWTYLKAKNYLTM